MLSALNNWFKNLFKKPSKPPEEPQAQIEFEGGKLRVKTYNAAFIDDLKRRYGDLTHGRTDEEIVNLFLDREQIEIEEPKLEVVHSGITEDGRIQMKLNWNSAFIRHLRENGITGDSEEEAVEKYLLLIGKDVADQEGLIDAINPAEAFREMDEMMEMELAEAAKQIEASKRESRKARRELKKVQNNSNK